MTNNTQAALDLHEWQKRVSDAEKRTGVAQPQFLLAASKPPKKYISKLQKAIQRTSRDGRSGKGSVDQAPGRSAPGFTHARGRDSSSKTGRRVTARCQKKGLHLQGVVYEQSGDSSGGSARTTVSPTHSPWNSSSNTSAPDTVNPVKRRALGNAHEAMVFLEEASAVPAERSTKNSSRKLYPMIRSNRRPGCTPQWWWARASVYSRIYAWWVLD